MMKMMKDTLVTTMVVGSFLAGAVGLVSQMTQPWPVAPVEMTAASLDQPTDSSCTLATVTYEINDTDAR